MNKLNALLIAIVATASMAFATPPPPEMVATSDQGNYTSLYGVAKVGIASTDGFSGANGAVNQGSLVTTTQQTGFGTISASTNNSTTLQATDNSVWGGANSYSIYGSTVTNLEGNGFGQSCFSPFNVTLNANGTVNTASQAALTTGLGSAFGNTATYGNFSLTYAGQGGVIGQGTSVGQGTSTVTPVGAYGAPGITVSTYSSSVTTVCPVVVK